MIKKGVVLHTRDLRIYDNRVAKLAYEQCDEVIHVFILNTHQLKPIHETMSLNVHTIEFMHNSLLDLQQQLQNKSSDLIIIHSTLDEGIKTLQAEFNFDELYIAEDYTPYAKKRQEQLLELSEKLHFNLHIVFEHLILDNPDYYVKPTNGEMYTVFTPMYKNCLKYEIPKPLEYSFDSLIKIDNIPDTLSSLTSKSFDYLSSLYSPNKKLLVKGGREEALQSISSTEKYNYQKLRDYPILSKTTLLSAHHKFGTISMRESCYFLSEVFKEESEGLIRELFWHDFYIMIAKHFPRVFEHSFQEKYENLNWDFGYEDDKFLAWCEGRTGFPIVDAGMRELNQTGYMHNRVRMIVASFLTKDLHYHWKMGEHYFASKLTDYDNAINNGSWQWGASTGCDAQPYFRIFNPWLQQKKFDENCDYIKKWIPELKDVPPKALHNLHEGTPLFMPSSYPKLIVIHKDEKDRAIEMFKL